MHLFILFIFIRIIIRVPFRFILYVQEILSITSHFIKMDKTNWKYSNWRIHGNKYYSAITAVRKVLFSVWDLRTVKYLWSFWKKVSRILSWICASSSLNFGTHFLFDFFLALKKDIILKNSKTLNLFEYWLGSVVIFLLACTGLWSCFSGVKI